jgi:DNA-binding MarR family transcriptional regulator
MARSSRSPAETAAPKILRHWPDVLPLDRFAHLVKHAARALARALQMRLAEHSVSYGHWTFLRILWETEGLTQRELSARAGVMEPTTFSALKAMEKCGYITRRRHPRSHKEIQIYLTPAGRALKRKLVPLAVEVNEVALRAITSADAAATRRTLLAVIRNLAADEAASTWMPRRCTRTPRVAAISAKSE